MSEKGRNKRDMILARTADSQMFDFQNGVTKVVVPQAVKHLWTLSCK